MEKEIHVIEKDMDKIYELGIVKGRMDVVNEMIDHLDGGIEFIESLKITQQRNGEKMKLLQDKSK